MSIESVSAQMIHCLVSKVDGSWQSHLTLVYAFNKVEKRQSLWPELIQVGRAIQGPWLVVGDFNMVLHSYERWSADREAHEVGNELKKVLEACQQIGRAHV